MPAKGQTLEIELSSAYGDILKAIVNNKKTLYSISKYLKKKHPTVIEQLKKMVKKNYLIPHKIKDGGRTLVEYEVNKKELIKYWEKKFEFKISKKIIETTFESELLELFNHPLFTNHNKFSIWEIGFNLTTQQYKHWNYKASGYSTIKN